MALHVEHQPVTDASAVPQAGYQAVSDAYFDTLRILLVRGRAFSTQDREDSQPVAIVSAALAERFWPGTDAVGRRIRLGDSNEWLTVVGIAGDVTMYNWWDGIDFSRVYVPLRQAAPGGVLYAAARTHGGAGGLAGSLRAALRSVDPNLPVQRVRTMERAIEESSLGVDFLAVLLTICGAIAGVLAMVGIYGMMAYAVSQRSREFGIRIALGGTARDILALTMRQAGVLTVAGLAAGCVLAAVFGSLMASALYGLVSIDVMTFLLVGAALGAASLAAAYLPARRTLRLDAAAILRA